MNTKPSTLIQTVQPQTLSCEAPPKLARAVRTGLRAGGWPGRAIDPL